jgi:hypothetical protein
VRTVIVGKTF